MHGVRQWWVRLSIVNKAIVLSCAFVIPILLVVGLLMNDFYDYREKSNDILSEYARCTDYMNAMEQENALLSELTLAAPGSDTIDKYADAVQDTACAWERLRSAETDGSMQSEVLKQVIFEEKERGATIIFSDHVMTNVEELCDDILMIRDGSVVLSGPVQEVRNSYGKTRLFVSNDFSKEELEALPHVTKVSMTKQGTWKLILDDASAGPELFDRLTKGHYLATFDHQAPTIDEIFKLESGVEV